MDIEIFEKKENVLFDRTEVKFYCLYEGEPTPKILDVKSKLITLLDTKKELIVVDNLQPGYGEPKAVGYAKVYGRESSLLDVEKPSIIAKNKEQEAPAEEDDEAEE
ncbi:30S ribosomal protein S24e [Methanobrevibacter olleyae]|uniref:Small ribosomal subunit protein eS24 n=1 Tax=Methanobrevibacter olleyae TaxID=294671 RepID=A0A126R1L6_METOL|nr:30S ribosomal protein S24e [Methanobrevibacter olleyae]AMK15535.1 ribosomal protein S24e Rps24e [Methanobrevibacter olleyae]SFL36953.1 small subunit ribosomal protein S24e [Methanobrevibacter olleyae]